MVPTREPGWEQALLEDNSPVKPEKLKSSANGNGKKASATAKPDNKKKMDKEPVEGEKK